MIGMSAFGHRRSPGDPAMQWEPPALRDAVRSWLLGLVAFVGVGCES